MKEEYLFFFSGMVFYIFCNWIVEIINEYQNKNE